MKLLRYFLIPAATALALAMSADSARADGIGCSGPGCAGGHGPSPLATTLFGGHRLGQRNLNLGLFQPKPKLPVFQAAPWYQYWPYDGHFLTPAPISGPFYGPPLTGNFPVNPYFPGPAMPYSGYGHGIPGGPPPGAPVPMPPGR